MPPVHINFLIIILIILPTIFLNIRKRQQILLIKNEIYKLQVMASERHFCQPNKPELLFSDIIHKPSQSTDLEQEWQNRILRHRKACDIYRRKPTLIEQYKDYFKTGQQVGWKNEPMTLIDTKHKTLLCTLPKTGSTNWRLTFNYMLDYDENENSTFYKNEWTSRKDKEGYRIRRSPSASINYKKLDQHENFTYDIPSKGKNLAKNNYGHFKIESVPPSLRNNGGRSGRVKILNGFSYQERIGIYTNETYFKSIVVRHPLEKLLSAYRDKGQPKYFKNKKGLHQGKTLRELMKSGINDTSVRAKLSELDKYAFTMFAIDLIFRTKDSWFHAGVTSRHWSTSTFLCRVCSINWDFIGKMETIESDSEKIMQQAGLGGKIHLGLHAPSNGLEKMVNYFKGWSKEMLLSIYDLYEEDFQIFGYEIHDEVWDSLSPTL